MKIFLWNVAMTPNPPPDINTRNSKFRAPRIAKVLQEFDIVVLNESFLYRDLLLKEAGFPYVYTEPRVWYKIFNSGVVILSRIPLSNTNFHHYTKASIWDWFTSKAIVGCTFEYEGETFELYGTHLQAGNNEGAQSARLQQAREIAEHVAKNHKPGNNIIICGDFNCGPVFSRIPHSGHYANPEDARQRNEQYHAFMDPLGLISLRKYEYEDDISSFAYKPSINTQLFVLRAADLPQEKINDEFGVSLSDTGPLNIEIRK